MEYYNIIDDRYLNALKQNIIYPVFKVELMDFAENVIGELTQDISQEESGSISINYQQGVRRSCSLTLFNVNENLKLKQGKYLLNENGLWVNTKFKLYTGVKVFKTQQIRRELDIENEEDLLFQDSSGQDEDESISLLYRKNTNTTQQDIYWFSQGIYLLTNPSVLKDMSKKTITINGIDKFGVFGSETNFNQTESTYVIEEGSLIGNVITSILNFDTNNGLPLDTKRPFIDPNAKTLVTTGDSQEVIVSQARLPFEINKSPETYFSDILIELANIYACDIYYDVEGRLHFEKGNEKQSMNDFGSLWDFSDKEAEYFNPQLDYDFTSVYNVIKVIGNNPVADLFVHIAKNEDPSSPTRIQLLGEKILYIESSFCYNEERTKDFANYMLRKKSMMPLTFSFQSSFMPHLDVNKIITITDDYYNYSQERFIIQSLTIPLTTKSLMDIECTNTAVIPYFEY